MTTVYDVQAIYDGSDIDVNIDYSELITFLEEIAMTDRVNCQIRADYGNYFMLPSGAVGLTKNPQIHIIVEGKETHQLQTWLEMKLAELKDYNVFDKYSIAKKILCKVNLRFLKSHSQQMAMFTIKNNKRTQIAIERSNQQKANVITMRPFRKK